MLDRSLYETDCHLDCYLDRFCLFQSKGAFENDLIREKGASLPSMYFAIDQNDDLIFLNGQQLIFQERAGFVNAHVLSVGDATGAIYYFKVKESDVVSTENSSVLGRIWLQRIEDHEMVNQAQELRSTLSKGELPILFDCVKTTRSMYDITPD